MTPSLASAPHGSSSWDPIGGGRPKVAISADGERVLAAAATTALDGDRRASAFHKNPADYLARAVSEVWVALHDAQGRELWRKKLPVAAKVEKVAVSDDGAVPFVHTVLGEKSALREPDRLGNMGFLLDGRGEIIAQSDRWGGGVFGAVYRAEQGGFVLGGSSSGFVDVAQLDGFTRTRLESLHLVPKLDRFHVESRSIQPCLSALLGVRKSRVLLVLMDSTRNVLLVRNVARAGAVAQS